MTPGHPCPGSGPGRGAGGLQQLRHSDRVLIGRVVAVASGLGGGVLFGAVITLVGRPGARRGEPPSLLSPSDRVAVMRAVQQGGPVPDRLAPPTLRPHQANPREAGPEAHIHILPAG
jgi:hypothetical protein